MTQTDDDNTHWKATSDKWRVTGEAAWELTPHCWWIAPGRFGAVANSLLREAERQHQKDKRRNDADGKTPRRAAQKICARPAASR